MSTATVIGVPVRWKWVPVEHCDSCNEDRPVDHRAYLPRLETSNG
jgi:hypothetical protein